MKSYLVENLITVKGKARTIYVAIVADSQEFAFEAAADFVLTTWREDNAYSKGLVILDDQTIEEIETTLTPSLLTPQETATILAALRFWQARWTDTELKSYQGREHFETFNPLTLDEIDDLCKKINFD